MADLFDKQKLQMAKLLLDSCPFMHINGTYAGCGLPPQMQRTDLVLRIGRDPNVMGMPDLELTEEGWSATLSVMGVRHYVIVPWGAVARIWVGEPFLGPIVIWPQSYPVDAETPPDGTPVSGAGSHLKIVH